MSIEEDINELKILLFQDRLTNYGKREMINYYENEIARQKQINEEHQKEIAELKEYIFIAPNLDEMTATKYANIQREAYFRGRAEEQQRAEQIIYEHYIPKQVVIDVLQNNRNELFGMTYLYKEQYRPYEMQIERIKKIEKELLEGEK